jgi:hypothetical protein
MPPPTSVVRCLRGAVVRASGAEIRRADHERQFTAPAGRATLGSPCFDAWKVTVFQQTCRDGDSDEVRVEFTRGGHERAATRAPLAEDRRGAHRAGL